MATTTIDHRRTVRVLATVRVLGILCLGIAIGIALATWGPLH